MIVKKGNPIRLGLAISDGETYFTVEAIVRDSNNVEISGSPFTVPHFSGGLHLLNIDTVPLPEGEYSAQYTVFEDAGKTTLSVKYGVGVESFFVTNFEDRIFDKIKPNPLLDNDARLDNLNTIPSLSTTSQLSSAQSNIITQITNTVDLSDGRVV